MGQWCRSNFLSISTLALCALPSVNQAPISLARRRNRQRRILQIRMYRASRSPTDRCFACQGCDKLYPNTQPEYIVGSLMKPDPTDPVAEFSTLVDILLWRALQQPEQLIFTHLLDGD